jgi:hypothetical protein
MEGSLDELDEVWYYMSKHPKEDNYLPGAKVNDPVGIMCGRVVHSKNKYFMLLTISALSRSSPSIQPCT